MGLGRSHGDRRQLVLAFWLGPLCRLFGAAWSPDIVDMLGVLPPVWALLHFWMRHEPLRPGWRA
jgi:hypothetical protein